MSQILGLNFRKQNAASLVSLWETLHWGWNVYRILSNTLYVVELFLSFQEREGGHIIHTLSTQRARDTFAWDFCSIPVSKIQPVLKPLQYSGHFKGDQHLNAKWPSPKQLYSSCADLFMSEYLEYHINEVTCTKPVLRCCLSITTQLWKTTAASINQVYRFVQHLRGSWFHCKGNTIWVFPCLPLRHSLL